MRWPADDQNLFRGILAIPVVEANTRVMHEEQYALGLAQHRTNTDARNVFEHRANVHIVETPGFGRRVHYTKTCGKACTQCVDVGMKTMVATFIRSISSLRVHFNCSLKEMPGLE